MAAKRKAKIAISLDPEVLELLDRHAAGRSRSRCVEEELLRALRAREWERLSAQIGTDEREEQLVRARSSYSLVDQQLARVELADRHRSRRQRRPKPR
jgi:metal-responsive CopG/Arc/MetJ family transcriptional regulator